MSDPRMLIIGLSLVACATAHPTSLRSSGASVSAETASAEVSPVAGALRSDPFEERANAELGPPMRHGAHGGGAQHTEHEEAALESAVEHDTSEPAHEGEHDHHTEASP